MSSAESSGALSEEEGSLDLPAASFLGSTESDDDLELQHEEHLLEEPVSLSAETGGTLRDDPAAAGEPAGSPPVTSSQPHSYCFRGSGLMTTIMKIRTGKGFVSFAKQFVLKHRSDRNTLLLRIAELYIQCVGIEDYATLLKNTSDNVVSFESLRQQLMAHPSHPSEMCPLLDAESDTARQIRTGVRRFLVELVVSLAVQRGAFLLTLEALASFGNRKPTSREHSAVLAVDAFFATCLLAGFVVLDRRESRHQAAGAAAQSTRPGDDAELAATAGSPSTDAQTREARLRKRQRRLGHSLMVNAIGLQLMYSTTEVQALCEKELGRTIRFNVEFFINARFRRLLNAGLKDGHATVRAVFLEYLKAGFSVDQTGDRLVEFKAHVEDSLKMLPTILRAARDNEAIAIFVVLAKAQQVAPDLLLRFDTDNVQRFLTHTDPVLARAAASVFCLERTRVPGTPKDRNPQAALCDLAFFMEGYCSPEDEDRVASAMISVCPLLTCWSLFIEKLQLPQEPGVKPGSLLNREKGALARLVTTVARVLRGETAPASQTAASPVTANSGDWMARVYLGEPCFCLEGSPRAVANFPVYATNKSRSVSSASLDHGEDPMSEHNKPPAGSDSSHLASFTQCFATLMKSLCQAAWDDTRLLTRTFTWPQYFDLDWYAQQANRVYLHNLLDVIARAIQTRPLPVVDCAVETLFHLCATPGLVSTNSVSIKDKVGDALVKRLRTLVTKAKPVTFAGSAITQKAELDSELTEKLDEALSRTQRMSRWFNIMPSSLTMQIYFQWIAPDAYSSKDEPNSVQLSAFALVAQSVAYELTRDADDHAAATPQTPPQLPAQRPRYSEAEPTATLLEQTEQLLTYAVRFLKYPKLAMDAFITVWKLLQAFRVYKSRTSADPGLPPFEAWKRLDGEPLVSTDLIDGVRVVVHNMIYYQGSAPMLVFRGGSMKPYWVTYRGAACLAVDLYCWLCTQQIIHPVLFDKVLADYVENSRYRAQIGPHVERLKALLDAEHSIVLADVLFLLFSTKKPSKHLRIDTTAFFIRLTDLTTRLTATHSLPDRSRLLTICRRAIDLAVGAVMPASTPKDWVKPAKPTAFLLLFNENLRLIANLDDLKQLELYLDNSIDNREHPDANDQWKPIELFREWLKREQVHQSQ